MLTAMTINLVNEYLDIDSKRTCSTLSDSIHFLTAVVFPLIVSISIDISFAKIVFSIAF
jgi:hypothetical protein